MECKTAKLVWMVGIVEKEVVTIEPGIYRLYSERKNEAALLHVEFDGHLWPVSHSIEVVRDTPPLNRETIEAAWRTITERWQHQYRIHLGIAEYLGKLEEGKALQAQLERWHDERFAQRRAEAEARQRAEKAAQEAAIVQAQADLRAGASISAEHFLILCKRHGVEIPLRTHGWIKRRLATISKTSYSSCGSRSERVFDVLASLLATLEA